MTRIAALFVADPGPYMGLPGVDPWPEARDARTYAGSDPVVAHPPCQRWGRYWHGGPSAHERRVLGDDAGCFASALATVRRVGGVIEHPEASHAWAHHGIKKPPRRGGWIPADGLGGWTCCVEQGHYGHRARKATWLYLFGLPMGMPLPELRWGPCAPRERLDYGYHSAEERKRMKAERQGPPPRRLSTKENLETPIEFRDVLISLARSVKTSP